MLAIIHKIIRTVVTSNRRYNIAVVFDTVCGLNLFREHFDDTLSSVPEWLLPEKLYERTHKIGYDLVTIDLKIANTNSLRGLRCDIIFISHDVNHDIFKNLFVSHSYIMPSRIVSF